MRLLISFVPEVDLLYDAIGKHTVQGFIYNLLRGTEYAPTHDKRGFKFFTFSDIFPSSYIMKHGELKNLVISSPNTEFIKILYERLKDRDKIKLGPYTFEVKTVKKFKLNLSKVLTTGSPIVLYKSNYDNIYFSFKHYGDLKFFLKRLKDNALKKYNAFYGAEYSFEGPLFDRLEFRREVAIPIVMHTKRFLIIGSTWRQLAKVNFTREERRFYSFLMDCGLGEKNSLGFGFINPVKEVKAS